MVKVDLTVFTLYPLCLIDAQMWSRRVVFFYRKKEIDFTVSIKTRLYRGCHEDRLQFLIPFPFTYSLPSFVFNIGPVASEKTILKDGIRRATQEIGYTTTSSEEIRPLDKTYVQNPLYYWIKLSTRYAFIMSIETYLISLIAPQKLHNKNKIETTMLQCSNIYESICMLWYRIYSVPHYSLTNIW